MRCLSCQNEVLSKDAKIVLNVHLCPTCAEMAKKAEVELERESARALTLAKNVLAQHILKGGLMRTKLNEPVKLVLYCPVCQKQHLDEGEWAVRPHKTHLCLGCGHQWDPLPDRESFGVAEDPTPAP